MAPKTHITRTYAPIHFEDLDPRRFEDLVRELLYDFRDWQSIEATGRSGGDDGFDVRAYERGSGRSNSDQDDEEVASPAPMDGNSWMVQVKREKTLGPTAVRNILKEVDALDPPFGYILAAPTVFSKRSYDAFRQELSSRGVMEFYLWGKPELEDMLHFPKNDRLLFAFFGISLVSRRRSRTTEVRAPILIKNRLYKVIGAPSSGFFKEVLLRDINDPNYPFEAECIDFDNSPKWIKRAAFEHHPLGLWVHDRRYYAYMNTETKEWDFTKEVNLATSFQESDEERERWHQANGRVREFWSYLPRRYQADLAIESLVRYDDIALVDAEGDAYYDCPHLFLQFSRDRGPFRGEWMRFIAGESKTNFNDEWTRVDKFPKKFGDERKRKRVRSDIQVTLDPETLKAFKEYKGDADTIYVDDERYSSFQVRDVVQIADGGEQRFLEVTHIERTSLGRYLMHDPNAWRARRIAHRQIGREVGEDDAITIIEMSRSHAHDWE